MKELTLIILTGLVILISCAKDESPKTNEVGIRIENVSEFDFKDVIVNTSGGENNYGNINSNETSENKTFESAYRYAFVELQIDGETYTLQPIDYVGETLLKSGQYVYEINANNSGSQYDRLSLTLKTD